VFEATAFGLLGQQGQRLGFNIKDWQAIPYSETIVISICDTLPCLDFN